MHPYAAFSTTFPWPNTSGHHQGGWKILRPHFLATSVSKLEPVGAIGELWLQCLTGAWPAPKKMLQPKSSCQTWRAAAPALVCAFGGSSREPVKNSNLAQRLFKQQSGFSFPVAVSIYRRKCHFDEFIENKIFAAPTKRFLKLHAAGLKPCFVFPHPPGEGC